MFWVATAFAVLLQAVAQEMTIDGGAWETPRMTDEDIQGQDVPQYLACDACRAVVGHARQALRQAESERSGKQLSEAAAIEVFEERVCQFNRKKLLDVDPDSFWHDYGVKLVDGGPRQGDKVLDGDAVRHSRNQLACRFAFGWHGVQATNFFALYLRSCQITSGYQA